jgi:hypothetical protein
MAHSDMTTAFTKNVILLHAGVPMPIKSPLTTEQIGFALVTKAILPDLRNLS